MTKTNNTMNKLTFTQIQHSATYNPASGLIEKFFFGLDHNGDAWQYDFDSQIFIKVIQVYPD